MDPLVFILGMALTFLWLHAFDIYKKRRSKKQAVAELVNYVDYLQGVCRHYSIKVKTFDEYRNEKGKS